MWNCAEEGYAGQNMLRMKLPGRKKRGRPKGGFLDVEMEDMKMAGQKES